MTDTLNLVEVHRIIETMYTSHPSDLYVELENEDEPNGMVVFKTKEGNVYMMMPRDVYEDILNT